MLSKSRGLVYEIIYNSLNKFVCRGNSFHPGYFHLYMYLPAFPFENHHFSYLHLNMLCNQAQSQTHQLNTAPSVINIYLIVSQDRRHRIQVARIESIYLSFHSRLVNHLTITCTNVNDTVGYEILLNIFSRNNEKLEAVGNAYTRYGMLPCILNRTRGARNYSTYLYE